MSTESIASQSNPAEVARSCPSCAAPMASDQRYCLECGERRTAASSVLAGGPPAPVRAAPRGAPPGSGGRASTEGTWQESEPTATPAPAESPAPQAQPSTPAPASTQTAASGGSEHEPSSSGGASGRPAAKLPAIKHVFVIMLSDRPYAALFGPESKARYITGTLEPRGALLVRYDAVAHEQLANEIALISGQGPTPQTAANCPTYADIAPATAAAHQQVLGSGCVYPSTAHTIAGQLTAKHLTWRAYVEGLDEPGAASGACGHPALGSADPAAAPPTTGETYATFANPFLYFHSVIDSPSCAGADVGLDQLGRDLAEPARTPSLSYIAPDLCHDGAPTPCSPGAAAGPVAADGFLAGVVPKILRSRAYKQSGLIVITVDEAPSGGEFGDSSACCGQPPYPNLASATPGTRGRGGGTVGALLLSPVIKGASTSQEPYNHFSLLRTVEDLFGLTHLGYAGLPAVKPLEAGLFTEKPSR